MKKLFVVFLITLLFYSCGNNSAEEASANDDSTDIAEPVAQDNYAWQGILNDSTGKMEMVKIPSDVDGPFLPENIIASINQRYPDIQLEFIKTSSDTVYTKIPDATYLTQQMGSAGPSLYISGVVYSLTEVPHIHYVNIDFKEGDHAQPGTFSREIFKNE